MYIVVFGIITIPNYALKNEKSNNLSDVRCLNCIVKKHLKLSIRHLHSEIFTFPASPPIHKPLNLLHPALPNLSLLLQPHLHV